MLATSDLSPRGHVFLILNIVTPIFACAAVLLRLWIRYSISKSVGWEDWLLVASMIFYLGAAISAALMAMYGFGSHITEISNPDILELFKNMFANGIFIYLCVILLRISICLLFFRITKVKWQRYILYSIAIITTIINLINLFRINIFYCMPVPLYWTIYVGDTNGTCVSAKAMSILLYVQYIISVLADWTTSLLPIFIMKDWVLNRRGKMATYGLLGMGIFASAAGIGAVVINPTAADTGDYTYTAFGLFVTQGLEPFIGLLAASFATYRPLFRSLGESIAKRRSGVSSYASSQDSSLVRVKSHGSPVVAEIV